MQTSDPLPALQAARGAQVPMEVRGHLWAQEVRPSWQRLWWVGPECPAHTDPAGTPEATSLRGPAFP